MALDKELVSILRCPRCRATLREEETRLVCVNAECSLAYPVRDGIPVMLESEAEKPARPAAAAGEGSTR